MTTQIIPTRVTRPKGGVDACAICCIDPDFRVTLRDYEAYRGHKRVTTLRHAGGAKALTEPGPQYDLVMAQLRLVVTEHQIKIIVPMLHIDCLAYGLLRQLSHGDQHAFYEREMAKVVESLRAFGLPIEPAIVHFDQIVVL